jgi:hypothetical protein
MQLTSLGIQDTLTFVQDPASVLPAELARYLPAGQLVHATAYSPEYFPTGHCAYTSVWLVSTCWNLSTTCNLLYFADLCDVLWILCPKIKTHRHMEAWMSECFTQSMSSADALAQRSHMSIYDIHTAGSVVACHLGWHICIYTYIYV